MDRQLLQNKAEYIIWAATQWGRAERSCPACDSSDTKLIKRKYWVIALYRCEQCKLMFRVPKNTEQQGRDFYQTRYRQGFTTDCPSDEELKRFLENSFRGSEKDYTSYIEIIKAAGLRRGDIVFDFGCSWGYGSWQFAQAGFRVYSYEISFSRARYAAEKLGCQ